MIVLKYGRRSVVKFQERRAITIQTILSHILSPQMADNHTPAGSSTSTASNISTVPQPQDAQVLPSQALEGKFMLSHGVRLSVVITSACLAACGLALIVLGAVGSSSNFLQGLSGLNAVVTGVSVSSLLFSL